MLPSSDLFELIHTMSKAEKRHFKIYAARNSRNGGSNYLRLFDAIDKQKTYNEEKLEEDKYGKRLAATKLFLYELILKSLRQSHSSKLINARLTDMLTQAEILFQKSLYKQSQKILIKAKKLATKYEAWDILYSIVQREIDLTNYIDTKKPMERLTNLQKELSRLANVIRQEMAYENLLGHAQILQRKYTTPLETHQEKILETIIQSPMMLNEPIGIGRRSRMAYHQVQSMYHGINGKDTPAFEALEEINSIWKQHPIIAEAHREDFVRTTVQLAISGLHSQKQYNYTGLIELLKVLPATAQQELEKRKFLVMILKFGYGLHIGDVSYCTNLLPQIEALSESDNINALSHYQRIYLYHQLAIYHFLMEDYEKAVDWLHVVQSCEKYGFFNDFRHFGRLMQLLAHYEQEHYSLVESKLRSIEHYIKTTGDLEETEQIIFRYIKDRLRTKSYKEEEKLLQKLNERISNIPKGYHQLPLKNIIVKKWLHNKVNTPVPKP